MKFMENNAFKAEVQNQYNEFCREKTQNTNCTTNNYGGISQDLKEYIDRCIDEKLEQFREKYGIR